MEVNKIIPPQTNPIVIKSQPVNEFVRKYNIQHLPATQVNNKNDFQGKVEVFTRDAGLYKGPLGTPVMADITFESVTYTDFITGVKKTTKKITLINVLINVSQAKKIITTEIQGRNGTIKEYIGLDDYNVNINGFIIANNGQSTKSDMIDLQNMCNARVQIPVTCDFLNSFGIFNIVIKDYTFNQEAGGYSKQPFTINALSDEDVVLKIM